MPDAEAGCKGPRSNEDIFINNVYKDADKPWDKTAAIMQAHAIGKANEDASGFEGYPWPGRNNKFDGSYY